MSYVLNGSFSSPDVTSNQYQYYKGGPTGTGVTYVTGSIINWVFNFSNTTSIVIVDGDGTIGTGSFNSNLSIGNQALGLRNHEATSLITANQSIYFTKGTYNLQFRTLYRSDNGADTSHSLTVDISNGATTVISKILNGTQTGMEKINVVSVNSDWMDTDYTKSLKSYYFNVSSDGSYNLAFKSSGNISTNSVIFLTNINVRKYYVSNGEFTLDTTSINNFYNNGNNTSPTGWKTTGTASTYNIVNGNPTASGINLIAGKQAYYIKQNTSGEFTLSQDLYFVKGVYNLSFRALYSSGKSGQSLSVGISNANANTALATKLLNLLNTGMNKLYDASATYWSNNESYKSYDFKVSSDGSYTLLFTYTADTTISSSNFSAIVLTDVVVDTQLPKPWGVYIAGHPMNTLNTSSLSGELFDITGQGRNAVIGRGVAATFASGSGNGALVAVPSINGDTTNQIIWPSDSIPATNFTLSSITRYTNTNTNRTRILKSMDAYMVHGHYKNVNNTVVVGHVFYNYDWKTTSAGGTTDPTSSTITTSLTNWCVTCATTNTNVTIPNNVLINNVAKGFHTGGAHTRGQRLSINTTGTGYDIDRSDFAFQQLVIWDSSGVLNADQLSRISTLQNNYLQTGTIQYPFSIISSPPVITQITDTPVTSNGKTNFSVYFTQDVVSGLDASFTYLYSTNGGQTFTDSYQLESPITIDNLSVDASYQFVIKHRSAAGDSEPSNIITTKHVFNGNFATPDLGSNSYQYYNGSSINNWSFQVLSGSTGIVICDGINGFDSYLPTNMQALGFQSGVNSSVKMTQSIYFTKGDYNLQFRTLYRGFGNDTQSLTVSVSNGTTTVLSNKQLDGTKTDANKINVAFSPTDWTNDAISLKTYSFTVTTGGIYNLAFVTAFPYTSGYTDTTVFLTNVSVNKINAVSNGTFGSPDLPSNTAYSSSPNYWTTTVSGTVNSSIVDGTGYSNVYLPASKQGFFLQQQNQGIFTLSQDIYFTKGFYNLHFRALHRNGKSGQSLSVGISNTNSTALATKQLNLLNTGMNKLYEASANYWSTNESYKSYDFNVSSDGLYTLLFTYTESTPANTPSYTYFSAIVLTDVVVETQLPKPWGVYIAGHPSNIVNTSSSKGKLFDITGQGRHADISGGVAATFSSGSGNGAVASVPYIQGTKNSLSGSNVSGTGSGTQLIWPSGSIPATNFTLSSITRYTNTTNATRILKSISAVHGHFNGYVGHVYYAGTWKTTTLPNPTSSNITDASNWCVTCATTDTSVTIPNNVLVNNVAKGTSNGGGSTASQLSINGFSANGEYSDFAFQQVVIWDSSGVLNADQLSRISTLQNNYLQTGTIQYPFSIISEPPVITNITNTSVVNRKTSFIVYFTQDVVSALDASFTYLYSTNGGQTFTDSLQIESPITIDNLNVDVSYQFVIKHRSTAGDSEPSNVITTQYVLNSNFSTPDLSANTYKYYNGGGAVYSAGSINNWDFVFGSDLSGGNILISDGSSLFNSFLPTNMQALGFYDINYYYNPNVVLATKATQSIYLTEGTYNLQFRTLYRNSSGGYNFKQSLTASISDGTRTVLSNTLNGNKTGLNKINLVSSTADWTNDTLSLKTYSFTVTANGFYNLNFETAFPLASVAEGTRFSTIFLTNVSVNKINVVLNSDFSTPDVSANTSVYYKGPSPGGVVYSAGSIKNWDFVFGSDTSGNLRIFDGNVVGSYLPTNMQALGLYDNANNISTKAIQSVYFTKGNYNLQFRTLYTGFPNAYNFTQSLTASISDGTNTILSNTLNGNKTGLNKINVAAATTDWTNDTTSLKTYSFNVTADGSYNLTFDSAFPYTGGTGFSGILLTNVSVNKYSYVLNGEFSTPDIPNNSYGTHNFVPSWDVSGVANPCVIVDGTQTTFSGINLPLGKQACFIKQTEPSVLTLSQNIYVTKGFYNLHFRAVHRAGKPGQSLSVDIYNTNYTALATKQLKSSNTGMNKLYEVSTNATYWSTNESYKSYDFNVSSDGIYTLLFTSTADATISSSNFSAIVLTDVVVEPQLPKPWGVYIAGHPSNIVNTSSSKGTLFDITGQGRHADISGGAVATFASGSGNGAVASVPYIQGTKGTLSGNGTSGSGTQIIWPSGSIPATNFTLSSITRYTNTTNDQRILKGVSSNMAHGHWAGTAGHVYYDSYWKTTEEQVTGPALSNITNVLDWCVTCATTDTSVDTPNNVLVNNVAKGTYNGGGSTASQLSINRSSVDVENSDFAFQQLVIWDSSGVLDAVQLLRISTLQNNYLQTGTIQYPFSIISSPPVITSITNTPVVNLYAYLGDKLVVYRKTDFILNFTIAAVGALDASFTYLYSTNGGQTFTDSYQFESPITINNLNEDQSYQFVIKHRSTAGDSEPSNIVTAIAKYPCFLEGSRILRMNVDAYEEEYVAIETLREGDLIKTSRNGYVPIKHIGSKTIPNPTNDPNKRNRLYRFPKSISTKMIADLYITGEHCVLYDDLSDTFKERVYEHMGDIYVTEGKYRVPACLDERALPYKGEGPATIWHFALENQNVTHNYGVYANGLLVESCSIDYFTKYSNLNSR